MSNKMKIKKNRGSGLAQNKINAYVKICTPYYESVSPETTASVDALNDTGLKYEWKKHWGVYIGQSRNELVGGESTLIYQKRTEEYTHYLFLDADIAFKPEDLLKLINDNLDVVTASYPRRGSPKLAVAGNFWRKDKLRLGVCGDHINMSDTGIKKVEWVGGGMLLVKKEVFEKIPYPWFRHKLITIDEPDKSKESIEAGEDMGFSILLREANIEIYCDCDVKVEHLETVGYAVMDEATIVKLYVEDKHVKFKQDFSKIPNGQYGNALLSIDLIKANLIDMLRYSNNAGNQPKKASS